MILLSSRTRILLLLGTTTTTGSLVLCLLLRCVSSFPVIVGTSSSRRCHAAAAAAAITKTTRSTTTTRTFHPIRISATVADDETQQSSSTDTNTDSSSSYADSSSSPSWKDKVLQQMSLLRNDDEASFVDHVTRYGNDDDDGLTSYEATVYALFRALRLVQVPLGLKGQPILWRRQEIVEAMQQLRRQAQQQQHAVQANDDTRGTTAAAASWDNFFTMRDLEKAVTDDFLDAARGSTDNRKGWKITDVSVPRGDSFEEARMTFRDVQAALEKGTVIMNAAGAHIPKLAGACLACCQASMLPAAVNLYVTAGRKRTSAPPHTDKQDVVVIQSTGQKYWKVYAPTDAKRKPMADIFARGKMDDDLPLYVLEKQSELLLETILHPGDVLFIPAAFPHTTGTVINSNDNKDDISADKENSNNDDDDDETTSVHLTFGLDHHIWDLDYLSARRLALRRARVTDTALGDQVNDALRYVGRCNELPHSVHQDLFSALPLGLLVSGSDDDDEAAAAAVPGLIQQATETLKDVCRRVDEHFQTNTFDLVDNDVWQETIERLVQQGVALLETHVDMYLAAMEEGRTRQAEDAMTAHLPSSERPVMSPERIQRLSLFRVKRYYDEINNIKQALQEWSLSGQSTAVSPEISSGVVPATTLLPANWAFTMPLHVGDDVEADLGGAFFAAKVSRIGPGGDTYDVQFFDGDRESGLERSQIKLLKPPKTDSVSAGDEVDTSKMTAKQLKRWKKQQEKEKLNK